MRSAGILIVCCAAAASATSAQGFDPRDGAAWLEMADEPLLVPALRSSAGVT
jgi:hypothetical protein